MLISRVFAEAHHSQLSRVVTRDNLQGGAGQECLLPLRCGLPHACYIEFLVFEPPQQVPSVVVVPDDAHNRGLHAKPLQCHRFVGAFAAV